MKTSQCTNQEGGRIAIFPGSFDPFTRGHESIVRRSLPLFDRFIIAIGVNNDKRPFMSTEQRLACIKETFKDDPRVEVVSYSGLTVDLAREGSEAGRNLIENEK